MTSVFLQPRYVLVLRTSPVHPNWSLPPLLRPVGQDVIRDFSNGSQFLLHDFGMADIGFAFDERTHLGIK